MHAISRQQIGMPSGQIDHSVWKNEVRLWRWVGVVGVYTTVGNKTNHTSTQKKREEDPPTSHPRE